MSNTKKSYLRQFIEIVACIATIVAGCLATWEFFNSEGIRKNIQNPDLISISPTTLSSKKNSINKVTKNIPVNGKKNITDNKKKNTLKEQNKNSPLFSQAKPIEDFSSYINFSTANKNGISILIIDEDGVISTTTSNNIADIYSKSGQIASVGLIKNSFLKTPEFRQLYEGEADIMEKLQLVKFISYLGLGKIKYSFKKGTLVDGSIICNASILMNIISTKKNSIIQSFEINANGNGVTEIQAKDEARQQILQTYLIDHGYL